MSTLERHCQLLLRAYPAGYREVRGEEIIGTLLEATPPERSWPLGRDVRGLLFGGLRARAMFNRQFTTAANLRTAALVGIAACLACSAAAVLGAYVRAELPNGGQHLHPVPVYWPQFLASALILVTVWLAWLTGRRMVVLAGALPAAAAVYVAWTWPPYAFGGIVVALAAMVALSGNSEPPSRRWFVPIGLLALLPMVAFLAPQFGPYVFEALRLTVAAAAIVWAVIDARPAIAVIVFLLGIYLPNAGHELAMGAIPVFVVLYLGVLAAIGVAAVWLLRRQSAHPSRPAQIP